MSVLSVRLFLGAIVFITGGLCYGAYRLGKHSDVWSIILAPLLLVAGWYALATLTRIGQGEGVSAGVVVIQGGIWYVGTLLLLLALILPGTGVYVRRSGVAGAVLGCVLVTILALGYQVASDQAATREGARPAEVTPEPHDSAFEGAVWAIDNGIQTEAGCVNGSAAFIDACKRAVRQRNEAARPR
jgi:hypothetical protein